jgi:hypothetical protein
MFAIDISKGNLKRKMSFSCKSYVTHHSHPPQGR